jgi:hypothetical protein
MGVLKSLSNLFGEKEENLCPKFTATRYANSLVRSLIDRGFSYTERQIEKDNKTETFHVFKQKNHNFAETTITIKPSEMVGREGLSHTPVTIRVVKGNNTYIKELELGEAKNTIQEGDGLETRKRKSQETEKYDQLHKDKLNKIYDILGYVELPVDIDNKLKKAFQDGGDQIHQIHQIHQTRQNDTLTQTR